MNQAMSYFVRILNTSPKSRKYNLRIKNLLNENPASLSWALLEAKCIMMTASPLLSFLVPCSHSKCTRNRPVRMGRQLWQGNRNCAGPLLALLINDQLPPPTREETAGSARGQSTGNLYCQIPVRACVPQSGLKGASCQAPFQGWCHFQLGLRLLHSRFRHKKGWPEDVARVESTAHRSPWWNKLFWPKWEKRFYHGRAGSRDSK